MDRQTLSSPVFVLGCQRSGTTLLCAILNRHPALYVVNELPWDSYDNLGGEADNLDVLTALLSKALVLPTLSELLSGVESATGFEILEALSYETLGKRTRPSLLARAWYDIHQFSLTTYWWQKRRRFDGLLAKLHRASVDKSNQ